MQTIAINLIVQVGWYRCWHAHVPSSVEGNRGKTPFPKKSTSWLNMKEGSYGSGFFDQSLELDKTWRMDLFAGPIGRLYRALRPPIRRHLQAVFF